MRWVLLHLYDACSKTPHPRVKAQIMELRRRRRQKLRRFANRYCPPEEYMGCEQTYLKYVVYYRIRFRIAVFLGTIACTAVLLHIGGMI